MKAILNYADGRTKETELVVGERGGFLCASMPDGVDYSGVRTVDFAVDYFRADAPGDGYLVLPLGQSGLADHSLCFFRERADCETVIGGPAMTMYGAVCPGRSFAAIVTGMTYDYQLVASVKDQVYTVYPRFLLHRSAPYEKMEVLFRSLPDGSDYATVCHVYRDYRAARGEIVPIRERMDKYPLLKEAVNAPFIRIRMGWKPVPTPVGEQTPENEPPMKVACTFEDVIALMEECRRQGIEHAEFCLVGWNIRGHDGRWPQIFPVEPALGGEEKLRELIARAKELGYLIVCHTNSTDAYSIADLWDENDIMREEDGRISQNETSWSGGNMYNLCPTVALEQARRLLPEVAELGFRGMHYIDVISTVCPRTCFSEAHPVTARQCVQDWLEIMRVSKELFGGFSSEGCFDFAAPELDFGLYTSHRVADCPLADRSVPLFALAYHGYVMANPYATTVNPTDEDFLKLVEYGARPAIYYYSQFVTPDGKRGNWMGDQDYACHTEQERRESVAQIAATYRKYQEVARLQTEFMENHEEIAPGVFRTTYSDGTVTEVDYHQHTYKVSPR